MLRVWGAAIAYVMLAQSPAVLAQSPLAIDPASLSPAPVLPVKVFAQLPRMNSVELSPDGTHIAFLRPLNGRFHVFIRPLEPANANALVIPPRDANSELRWVAWASNDRVLVGMGRAMNRGNMQLGTTTVFFDGLTRETRMLAVDKDGKNPINPVRTQLETEVGSRIGKQMGVSTAIVQDRVIHMTPDDPDTFLMVLAEDYTRDTGVVVRKVNVNTGAYTNAIAPQRSASSYSTDQTGAVRLTWGVGYRGKVRDPFLRYLDPATNKWVESRDHPLLGYRVNYLGFTPDPNFVYAVAPVNDRRSVVKMSLQTGAIAEVLIRDDRFDVENFAYDRATETLIGAQLAGGDRRWVYIDPLWQRRIDALKKALPGQNLQVVSMSLDKKCFILRASGPTEPGTYYLFDMAVRKLEPFEFDYADLSPDTAAPRQAVRYTARDGLPIEAFLTLPRGVPAKNLPTVLLPHGGPWAHDTIDYDYLAAFLANRGYAVLQPNFRGSTGYGESFELRGNQQWGLAMQDDITDAAQWLAKQGIADAKRMCIVGGSYGGYAALMAAVKTPDMFKCNASFNGVSDLIALLTDDAGGFKDEVTGETIGFVARDRERLEATSPLRQADKIRTPVLLVHAKDDVRVDIAQSRRMYARLKDAGKPVEFIEIERGEHWLENEAARVTFMSALETFLAKHLR
jgi:acetyl esterase/lipase